MPELLETSDDVDRALKSENLLLGQTCGYDIPYNVPKALKIVGLPVYTAPGCEKGLYSSVVVTHKSSKVKSLDRARGSRLVINGYRSYSGFHGLLRCFDISANETSFFSELRVSGSHKASLEALQSNQADIASIDSVTWELLKLYCPQLLNNIQIIGQTSLAPSPPYVTALKASSQKVNSLRRAIMNFFECPKAKEVRDSVLLRGMVEVEPGYYDRLRPS